MDLRTAGTVEAQVAQGAGHLGARGPRQDLVADDDGAVHAVRPLDQALPVPDRVRLQPAPRQLHQVERGEEVRVEPVGGVGDAVPLEQRPVPEQDVLQVGRTGLGRADVQQHLRRTHSSPPFDLCVDPVACSAASASGRTPRAILRPGRSNGDAAGRNAPRSPSTRYPARVSRSVNRLAWSVAQACAAGVSAVRVCASGRTPAAERRSASSRRSLVPGREHAEHHPDPARQLVARPVTIGYDDRCRQPGDPRRPRRRRRPRPRGRVAALPTARRRSAESIDAGQPVAGQLGLEPPAPGRRAVVDDRVPPRVGQHPVQAAPTTTTGPPSPSGCRAASRWRRTDSARTGSPATRTGAWRSRVANRRSRPGVGEGRWGRSRVRASAARTATATRTSSASGRSTGSTVGRRVAGAVEVEVGAAAERLGRREMRLGQLAEGRPGLR